LSAGYGELIAALQRVHLQLKKNGIYVGNKSDPDVTVIQCLLLNPEFVRVLSVHNKVQQLWPPTTTKRPVTLEAQNLVRDVSIAGKRRYVRNVDEIVGVCYGPVLVPGEHTKQRAVRSVGTRQTVVPIRVRGRTMGARHGGAGCVAAGRARHRSDGHVTGQ